MKNIGFLIGIGGTILFLGLMIVIPVVVLGASFWWFWTSLILTIVIWGIVGGVFIALWFSKKKPIILELDLEKAKERAVYEIKNDKDNPDNFKIDKCYLWKIGSPGKKRTPVHILIGKGTEKLNRRVVIINGNNPEKEITFLIDPTQEEIKESARLISDEPPELEYVYEPSEMDFFGNQPRVVKRTRPSTEVKEEKAEVQV